MLPSVRNIVVVASTLALPTACSAAGLTGQPAPSFLAPTIRAEVNRPNALRGTNPTSPTLYILNGYTNNAKGWVSAYSDAGATFVRKFGTVSGNGPETTSMAADASGHLYLYSGHPLGQVLVYKHRGAGLLQALQFSKESVFSSLTLDNSGNLFAMVKSVKNFAGPLDEFMSIGKGFLKAKPFVRRAADPLYIATDAKGDVGAAGGINGFTAFNKKSKIPFWTLQPDNTVYTGIAFDPSNNLYVVEGARFGSSSAIFVYARGASTPTYSITNGVYAPALLSFDGSGNLYVLDYCTSSCGSSPSSVIAIYAPRATSPTRVLQPPSGSNFGYSLGVSSSGYVAAIEYKSGSANYPVVVYPPGSTIPSTTISGGLQAPVQVVFGN